MTENSSQKQESPNSIKDVIVDIIKKYKLGSLNTLGLASSTLGFVIGSAHFIHGDTVMGAIEMASYAALANANRVALNNTDNEQRTDQTE